MKVSKPEFQAIVMAGGKGSRMPELSSSRPRCLLPIGNKPLVWYPLQMLERAGFTDVILIVLESQRSDIQKAIDKTELKIKIDYVYIPSNEDLGTADSLRLIHDKIISDVVVVSCDLITNFNLDGVFDLFRKHDASLVSLLFDNEKLEVVPMPGPKSKHKPERDLIGLDLQTDRLVFQASSSDFDDMVTFSLKLLRKHPNITLFNRLLDSHFYIMKRWVLDYVSYEKNFSTLKGELIPHIVKKQLAKKPKMAESEKNQSVVNAEVRNDIFQFAMEDELTIKVRKMSSYNDHFGNMKPAYHDDIIRCYSFMPKRTYFGIRINTLQTYCLANSKILDMWNDITSNVELIKQHSGAQIKSNQVDERCLIGENSVISEKTSIKNTFIGAHCEINNKVRISNCILMNNVKISESCVLQNCIICDGVTIETKVELKDCLVGNNHTITSGSNHSNEVLTAADKLMEI